MDGATILAVIERPYPLAAEELGLVVEARPTPTEPEPKPAQPGHGWPNRVEGKGFCIHLQHRAI